MDNVFMHLIENLELYGFVEDKVESLFQCIKELVDNGIDAGRCCGKTRACIEIKEDEYAGHYNVIVMDEGQGIVDVAACIKAFATTSLDVDDNNPRAGKFGVGLTCVVLYSSLVYRKPVVVTTKTLEDQSPRQYFIEFHPATMKMSCTPSTTNCNDAMSASSGTKVQLLVLSSIDMKSAVSKIEVYFQRLAFVPQNVENLQLRIHSSAVTFEKEFFSDPSWCFLTGDRAAKLSLVDAVAFRCYGFGTSRQSLKSKQESFVQITVLLVVPASSAQQQLQWKDVIDHHHQQQQQRVIPVCLWRFANGIPLLETNDDAFSCGLSSAARTFNWKLFGFQLRLCEQQATTTTFNEASCLNGEEVSDDPLSADDGESPDHYPETSVPDFHHGTNSNRHLSWLLESTRNEASSTSENCTQNFSLLVIAQYAGSSVPFTSMRKTSVTWSIDLESCVHNGLDCSIRQLQEDYPRNNLFLTNGEYKRLRTRTSYIPTVAAAVAKMIQFAPSPDAQSEFLELLNWSGSAGIARKDGVDANRLAPLIRRRLEEIFEEQQQEQSKRTDSSSRKRAKCD